MEESEESQLNVLAHLLFLEKDECWACHTWKERIAGKWQYTVEKAGLWVKTPAVPLEDALMGKDYFFGQVDPYKKWRCCAKWSPKTLGGILWCLRSSENCLGCFKPISSVIKIFTYPSFLLHNFRALISRLGRGGQFQTWKKVVSLSQHRFQLYILVFDT